MVKTSTIVIIIVVVIIVILIIAGIIIFFVFFNPFATTPTPTPPPPTQPGDIGDSCTTNTDCRSNLTCENGTCKAQPGNACSVDTDCTQGHECTGNICVESTTCTVDEDCISGKICEGGECKAQGGGSCTSNNDCISSKVCINGTCTDQSDFNGPCEEDEDCSGGNICDNNLCKKPLDDSCDGASQCAPSSLICNLLIEECKKIRGQTCSANVECNSGVCSGGVCVGGLGENCSIPADCAAPTTCDFFRTQCVNPLGGACTVDQHCPFSPFVPIVCLGGTCQAIL